MSNQAFGFYRPSSLLSVDTNPKTIKGQKYGFKTGVLYMAPYNLSGYQLCAMADIAKCADACLHTAGNPAFMQAKQKGRINKARYYMESRNAFMNQLIREIIRTNNKIQSEDFTFLVRLNGTTDIKWENIGFAVDSKTAKLLGVSEGTVYENIFQACKGIQFYDYTKQANRNLNIPNYDLTFSYSGVPGYQPYVQKAVKHGLRLAVVFRDRKAIPDTFMGLPVVDGDDSDIRHLDPQGCIVALYAKGKAKKDTSGFVVDSLRRVVSIGKV